MCRAGTPNFKIRDEHTITRYLLSVEPAPPDCVFFCIFKGEYYGV